MATSRPPGGGSAPSARLSLDLSSFQSAPAIAREAGRATAREISNAFKTLQAEQKLAQTQANTTLAAIKAQQAQITATTKAESTQRIALARSEAATQAQVARASAATTIEEERRKTAAFKTELRERERANRQSQVSGSSFGSNAATFAGAALGGPIGGLAMAATSGNPYLAAGLAVSQVASSALEANATSIAYDRQRVAATNLAGSQGKLNDLLATYAQEAGGSVAKAEALANVTKLMAVGFADDAPELEKFTRAIRGISIAMGTDQDTVTQNLILELFSQRGQRLDQLGLEYQKVRVRVDELRAADASLTQQQAYQNAVLEQAEERFGVLADSLEGQRSGAERAGAAWKNFQLQLGGSQGGVVDTFMGKLAGNIDTATASFRRLGDQVAGTKRQLDALTNGGAGTRPWYNDYNLGSGGSIGQPGKAAAATTEIEGARQIRLDWAAGITELNAQTHDAIIAEETSFGTNRASTVSNYNKSVSREAEDFARQRLYAERKFALSLLDVAQDSARQRVKWEEELARNIAQAQADSAERVAELREDSGKQLAESEEKYAEDREKRQREHQKTLREAAANLDAVAVREEQRRYRDEAKEAKDAHEEQKQDIGAQLQERLDDEAKALAKSESQARETNARRVEEQAENDALRIEEMKQAFAEQKIQEDEERGIRLGRQAEDHAAQLAEMDAQHGLRLNQIRTQAIREREVLQAAADEALIALGAADEATRKRHEERELAEEKLWDKFHKHITDSMTIPQTQSGGPVKAYASGGYVPETGLAMLHAGEYVMPAQAVAAGGNHTSNSRSITIASNAVVVYASPGMDEEALGDIMLSKLTDYMEDFAS